MQSSAWVEPGRRFAGRRIRVGVGSARAWERRFVRRRLKRPPEPEYLEALGATEDEMTTHAGNAARAREAGFRVLSTATSNDDEWDEYEGRYCAAIERYVEVHPDDPDADAMAARICGWHEAYLRWGRDTLGFGFYVLLKPTRALTQRG